MKAIINPKKLSGVVTIPPSKSLSHRAVIAAALTEGASRVDNLIFSEDIQATCEAMAHFGVSIDKGDNFVEIAAKGGLEQPKDVVECRESGSTLRFLVPFGAMVDGGVTFDGKGKLRTRPLTPYFDIFNDQGIQYEYNSSLPLTVEGRLKAGEFRIPGDISSQFITGLMFLLPLMKEDSTINITGPLESKGYIDLTIDVLNKFGVTVQNENHQKYRIKGGQVYQPTKYRVEGDYSQVAFWIVAGLIGDGIECVDMVADSLQGDREVIEIVERMGGALEVKDQSIVVTPSKTKGTIIDASQCPDIIPVMTVLAAVSEGVTEVINGSRLRIKESDRIKAIVTELNKLGADVTELENGIRIVGKSQLKGGVVDSWNDHRIAMSLAVASIRCTEEVTITNCRAIEKSYPTFYEDFKQLGGDLREE